MWFQYHSSRIIRRKFFFVEKKNTNERKYSLDAFNLRTNVTFAPHAYTYAHARCTIRDVDTGQGTWILNCFLSERTTVPFLLFHCIPSISWVQWSLLERFRVYAVLRRSTMNKYVHDLLRNLSRSSSNSSWIFLKVNGDLLIIFWIKIDSIFNFIRDITKKCII